MPDLKIERGWLPGAWWALALMLLCGGMAQAGPVGTLIPAPNRWDMVYDVTRDVVYITNGSQILRYRIATNTFLTPYDCGAGASLSGIDLSPDGNTLIACDTSYDTNSAWVRVVDLTTDTVRRQDFPRFWNESGTFAVAFGNDGSAIITSRFAGSGSVQMRRYYPATGALTWLPSVQQDTMASASADGTVIGLAEANSTGGDWNRYRIADGSLFHAGHAGVFVYEIGVNRNATQYAVPTYFGTYIYNSSFATLFTIGSHAGPQPIGVAYHPTKDIVYFPWAGSPTVRAYRTTDFTLLGTYDFGYAFDSPGNRAFSQGRTKVARDGSYIFCTVAGGVRYTSATVPTAPTSLVVDKPAPRVGEDVTATASGSWHPEGLAINYVYDWSKVASAGEYVSASAFGSAQSKRPQILRTAIKRFTSKAWGDYMGAVLPGTQTARGDQWQVRVRVVDGSYSSEWLEGPTVTVGNTPPSTPTTLTTNPYNVYCYSTPRAIASGSTDADGDSPLTYQFQWAKWDTSAGAWGPWGRTSTDGALGDVTLTKGDRWQVRARAFDGTNYSLFAGPYAVTVANAPPTVPTTLMVTPANPLYNSTLTAKADGSIDPDGVASVTYRYEWSKWSGSWWGQWLYSSTDGILKGVTLRRGDRWRVQARGVEGAIGGLAFSPPVEVIIEDTPPSAPTSLVVTPENPTARDVVTAQSGGATDADTGDAVSYKYQWSEQEVGGTWSAWGYDCTDGKLTGASVHGGAIWRVQCCATDGTLDSAWTAPAQVTFANTAPPAPTVVISPATPKAGNTLSASASAADADGDTLAYTYQWSQWDGSAWGGWGHQSANGVLSGVTLHRGDRWKARAQANDAVETSAWQESAPVTVVNAAPTAPAAPVVAPANPTCTSSLVATTGGSTDPDIGDTVSYKYQWSRQEPGGEWGTWGYDCTDGKLAGVTLHRGETWRVQHCATDGTLDSPWSDPVQVTISNSLPTAPATVTITPSPTASAGQALTAMVNGITDADGDPLEYLFQWTKSRDGGLTWEDWGASTTTTHSTTTLPEGMTALGERWKVRAAANDSIADGQWLESDAVSVALPGVVLNQPEGSSAGPSWPVIRVGFAQPMNKSLTQAAFSLAVDGSSTPVHGSFVWVGDEMKYYVQGALAPLTTYRATVAATAETATGVAMSAPFTWTFTTNNVPALNSWSPKPAATLNAVVRVAFNQPMDTAATEGAFSVKIAGTSTPVAGSFGWSGNELVFAPSATLTADTTYRASLTTAAKSAAGIALGAAFSWDFKTNHGPTVVLNQPQGTNAGPSWPVIRVGFDQAMNGALTQAAFSLTPNGTTTPVPGIFGWSGNEMRYYVQGALAPLTTYRVTVAATAQSATGVAMGTPFSWTFTTNNVPAIASWTPKSAVPLNAAVRLGFNQAMNQALTQGAFSLKVAGSSTPLPGSFSWSGSELVFTPSALLAADTTYRASITTAAQS
ncbi:MAG: Ig-like domain-containing protein, partial [Bacteroidota bacterium]